MYYVYLIQCEDKSIYTGVTNDLERRFLEHKNKIGGHYTSAHKVEKIIYTEKYQTRSEALRRESQIKGWRREKKLKLISETPSPAASTVKWFKSISITHKGYDLT